MPEVQAVLAAQVGPEVRAASVVKVVLTVPEAPEAEAEAEAAQEAAAVLGVPVALEVLADQAARAPKVHQGVLDQRGLREPAGRLEPPARQVGPAN